ncbi:DUF6762 family protein [Peptostreptococcaceae bacterium AGR-M142]
MEFENYKIILIEKDNDGLFKSQLNEYVIDQDGEFVSSFYKMNDKIYLSLTVDREVLDWEFSAIYDYYDLEVFNEFDLDIFEKDEDFNPTWTFVFDFCEDLNEKVDSILRIHKKELEEVCEAIKDKEEEYK